MGNDLILPVPQLSVHCQGGPILSVPVGLIQRHSYIDVNYIEVSARCCLVVRFTGMPENILERVLLGAGSTPPHRLFQKRTTN